MQITTNQTYEMKNVISYRAKMTQVQINQIMKQLSDFISENDLTKSGCFTTSTFAVENINNQPVMDIELLCPVDREITLPSGFTFKSTFRLNNAVKIVHTGNPALMQSTVNELTEFLKSNHLTPVTSIYNVTVVEPKSQQEIDSMVVDMYIGVSQNIL